MAETPLVLRSAANTPPLDPKLGIGEQVVQQAIEVPKPKQEPVKIPFRAPNTTTGTTSTPPPAEIHNADAEPDKKESPQFMNYKWMGLGGLIGWFIGSRSENPIFRALSTILGLFIGARFDGKDGLLGAYMSDKTNSPANVNGNAPITYPGQNIGQAVTNGAAVTNANNPPKQTILSDAIAGSKDTKHAFNDLEKMLKKRFLADATHPDGKKHKTLTIEGQTQVSPYTPHTYAYSYNGYGCNYVYGYNTIIKTDQNQANAIAGMVAGKYKNAEFRGKTADEAAAIIFYDPNIGNALYGDQNMRGSLAGFVKANHDSLAATLNEKISREAAIGKLPQGVTGGVTVYDNNAPTPAGAASASKQR